MTRRRTQGWLGAASLVLVSACADFWGFGDLNGSSAAPDGGTTDGSGSTAPTGTGFAVGSGSGGSGPSTGADGATGAGGTTSSGGSVGTGGTVGWKSFDAAADADGAGPDAGETGGQQAVGSAGSVRDGEADTSAAGEAASDAAGGGPADGDAVADATGPVDRPPTVCSLASVRAVTFTVVNNYSNVTVTPYWIDSNCLEQAYPQVGPGSTESIGSFVTHAWRIRNSSDHTLLVDVPPLVANTTVAVP